MARPAVASAWRTIQGARPDWDETPAQAARADRDYWDRDTDYDRDED